jgi:MSHA biogenesis protein MshP
MTNIQRGFSLVTAIFLLVVLSFLGVAMVTLSTTQHQGEALDVMGARAYQAARAGIEWAAFNVASSPLNSATPAACATTFTKTLGATLAPFTVAVTCTATSYTEGGSTIWIYDVTSTATAGSTSVDSDYVQRVVSAKMGK